MYWIMSAGTNGAHATMAWITICQMWTGSFLAECSRIYSAASKEPAGRAGTMYPGSFDCEIEKKRIGTVSQIMRNRLSSSPDRSFLFFFNHILMLLENARVTNTVQGISASNTTGR